MKIKKNVLIDKERENSYFFAIGIIFILSLFFSFFMSSSGGDDLTYLNRLNSLGYIKASVEHYNTWSSRTIIEITLMFFSKYFILWKIANAAVMTGTVWLITHFICSEIDTKKLFLTFGLYSFVPLKMMGETGWAATSLNYHWAFFFALVAFYPFYQKLKNEKITTYFYIVSLIALVYSSSQEQVNLCFLVFTFLISLYLLKMHHYDWKLSISSIISLIGMISFFMSPGNASRTNAETIVRFPEFAHYSLVKKFDLGVSSFGKPFFLDTNILFFIFFSLVAFVVYKKSNNYYVKLLSTLPLGINFIVYLSGTMKLGFINVGGNPNTLLFSADKLNELFLNTGTNLSARHPSTWLPTLLILGLLLCLIIGLLVSFENIELGVLASLMLLMAFSARLIMGFSPTVWVSGVRTFYVTYMIILILILMLLNEAKIILAKKNDGVVLLISVLGICTFLLTFFNR